jgi:hypothetical protein
MYINIFFKGEKLRFKVKSYLLPLLIQRLKENYNVNIINANLQNICSK